MPIRVKQYFSCGISGKVMYNVHTTYPKKNFFFKKKKNLRQISHSGEPKKILRLVFYLHSRYVVHFLVQPNFELVTSLLDLFVARKVAQMTTEMIECYHLR
jgi:hypothetical protein